ncbi:hypothetical protein HMF8227_01746 [Saliniradius amylolyticus]|uniref:Uncharacterized protein n=1 Tax=Saliniradius amylolyticus TaxID=2183582 RepID=A0A2S2E3P9_9ALTE|nr:hypothetical protein [Saliniradius amylolyticus]AWL12219.1 hypothetical protein HMF8227_01746 [Saliniradius amylolyticus]
MGKGYYLVLLLCFLTANGDLIKATIFPHLRSYLPFTFWEYMGNLLFNLVPLVIPLLFLGLYHMVHNKQAKIGAWASLVGSYLAYIYLVFELWAPIAEGARMSSTFAIGVVFSLIYANLAGLGSGLVGIMAVVAFSKSLRAGS